MIYSFILDPRAELEYLESINWYLHKSLSAAKGFVEEFDRTMLEISRNPKLYRNTFGSFREAILKKYPFIITFIEDEAKQLIIVESVFHQSRDPQTKFEA